MAGLKLRPIPDYGDLLTLKEFQESVEMRLLIDYDGSGCWATATECDEWDGVYPSLVLSGRQVPPPWTTHVVWFNR